MTGISSGVSSSSRMTYVAGWSPRVTTSPTWFQSSGVREASTDAIAAPATSSTASARPPTTVRPGRDGSTSRPPGAPERNAVMSRRRENE